MFRFALDLEAKAAATLIHVLYSNFMDIGRPEVSETMRCFDDKKVRKMCFFATILRSFAGRRQKFAGERNT